MESAQHFLLQADGRPIFWGSDGVVWCDGASLPITPLRAAMLIEQYEPAMYPAVWAGGKFLGTWYRRARHPSSAISCETISATVNEAPNQMPAPSSRTRSQET